VRTVERVTAVLAAAVLTIGVGDAALRPVPAQAADGHVNFILNDPQSQVAVGVIHLKDYNYGHGTYDVTIAANISTFDVGWQETAGWYTGPNYCTQQYRSDFGGPFHRQEPDLGPGIHYIGPDTSYDIYVYRGTC
jgi:hypothetical protein